MAKTKKQDSGRRSKKHSNKHSKKHSKKHRKTKMAKTKGMSGDDPYSILGVSKNASLKLKDIKTAYKKLAVKHHPDKGGDAELFKKIDGAYKELQKKLEPKTGPTTESLRRDIIYGKLKDKRNELLQTLNQTLEANKGDKGDKVVIDAISEIASVLQPLTPNQKDAVLKGFRIHELMVELSQNEGDIYKILQEDNKQSRCTMEDVERLYTGRYAHIKNWDKLSDLFDLVQVNRDMETKSSPKEKTKESPKGLPAKHSPKASPKASPKHSPNASPKASPKEYKTNLLPDSDEE